MALPLRLEPADIVPLGRPGRTEPDFIFFPKQTLPIPYYGVIELKKPSSPIVTVTRSNVAILSRDAETAISQAEKYSQDITCFAPVIGASLPVFLGNRAHLFVVMGMSSDLSARLATDVYRDMVSKRLPPNLQLMPFDTLLANFESVALPQIHVLVPNAGLFDRQNLVERVNAAWSIVYGSAVRFGERDEVKFRKSSHGYRPEWMVQGWLPELGSIDELRTAIARGLPEFGLDELRTIMDALEAAIPKARERDENP